MNVTFHSWLKSSVGIDHVEIEPSDSVLMISDLAQLLAEMYPSAAQLFENPEVLRYVVDHRYIQPEHPLGKVKAIDIYPPITGG